MTTAFDIFRIDGSDQPAWQDVVPALDDALARVQQLAATHPGQYFIRSQKTSVEVSMRVNRWTKESSVRVALGTSNRAAMSEELTGRCSHYWGVIPFASMTKLR